MKLRVGNIYYRVELNRGPIYRDGKAVVGWREERTRLFLVADHLPPEDRLRVLLGLYMGSHCESYGSSDGSISDEDLDCWVDAMIDLLMGIEGATPADRALERVVRRLGLDELVATGPACEDAAPYPIHEYRQRIAGRLPVPRPKGAG